MKIKRVESILKARKTIITYHTEDKCQWIGDGSAFYPIYNLPPLTEENIFAMFDIAESKRDKFFFAERTLPDNLSFKDTDATEVMLDRAEYAISFNGRNLEPLKTSQGVAFIDKRYLSPFENTDNSYELYERTTKDGAIYFAVKNGFLLLGVIAPYDLVSERFIMKLKELLVMSQMVWANKEEQVRIEEEQELVLYEEHEEAKK